MLYICILNHSTATDQIEMFCKQFWSFIVFHENVCLLALGQNCLVICHTQELEQISNEAHSLVQTQFYKLDQITSPSAQ